MYSVSLDFKAYTEEDIPLNFEVEDCSGYTHHHLRRYESGCALSAPSNRFFLSTPSLSDFTLTLHSHFTYTENTDAHACIHFRYDREARTGLQCSFSFSRDGNLTVSLHQRDRLHTVPVGEPILFTGDKLHENTSFPLTVTVQGDTLTGSVNGHEFAFSLPAAPNASGAVGFSRPNFPGEWVMEQLTLTADRDFPETELIPLRHVFLPRTEGGTVPYELEYRVFRLENRTYVGYRFHGGVQERYKYHPPLERTGQLDVEMDRFYDPYLKVFSQNREPIRVILWHGMLCVADPGMYWREYLEEFLDIHDLPLEGVIPVPDGFENGFSIAFGYEYFIADGYRMQAGGPTEYRYDACGSLTDEGRPGERYELLSPPDKDAVKRIPQTVYHYEEVRHHFAVNHYFSETEPIDLTLRITSARLPAYRRVEAELRDVYDHTKEVLPVTPSGDNLFRVTHDPLPVGLYRIAFLIRYGDRLERVESHIFEVFDSTGVLCAPQVSGLPILFSTPNEQRYLDRDAFDPWNPMPTCDSEHYFSYACFTGVYGEEKRVWEVLRLFGRKWYVWFSGRTMNEFQIENHPDLIRGADFIESDVGCIHRMRNDYWKTPVYATRLGGVLDTFMRERPAYAEALHYIPIAEKPMDQVRLTELMQLCGNEWIDYANEWHVKEYDKSLAAFKALNPSIERGCYGPYSIYVTPTLSYFVNRMFGFPPDERIYRNIFTGFNQFEDYPYSCRYHTYRGAYSVMTMQAHFPELKIYPEQYRSSVGGCIDGAVKFATPPMGAYTMPLYFNNAHAFDYAYNTPAFTPNGFVYWHSYGFMKRDNTQEELDAFVKGWEVIPKHKPVRPLRCAAFITDYDPTEMRFENGVDEGRLMKFYHISEEGHGLLYECLREAGIPGGFALTWQNLSALTPEDTDLLILPSLVNAPDFAIGKIRALYEAGVSLFAVSDVTGLEDLFGVRKAPFTAPICRLDAGSDTESVFPLTASFFYQPVTAETVVTASGMPALLRHKRTALLNASVNQLGKYHFTDADTVGRVNISRLLRKQLRQLLRALSSPLALGEEQRGLTLFRDEHGNTLLLAIDYTDYVFDDASDYQKDDTVTFALPVKDVIPLTDAPVNCLRGKDGRVEAAVLTLKKHQGGLFAVVE